MFGTDPSNIAFNLYRNGTKINSTPITGATNYVDTGGTTSSTYTVRAVINGQEQEASKPVSVWAQNYLQIPFSHRQARTRLMTAVPQTLTETENMKLC